MKSLVATIFSCLLISVAGAQDTSVDNQNFGSAEERIVYNKQNNIYKYEGVLVEYQYKLVSIEEKTKEEWTHVSEHYFKGLVGLETYAENGSNYFSVLTEGSRENHEKSYTLVVDLGYKIELSARRYHLK